MTDAIASEIVAFSPTGAEIDRTYETMTAGSHLAYFYLNDDGTLAYEHSGETDEFWDGCETVTRNGKVVFLDTNGEEWTADQLTFKDTEGNVITARPGWNDAQPTHQDKQDMAARAMLAALEELRDSPYFERLSPAKHDTIYAAIAQAKAAGITTE